MVCQVLSICPQIHSSPSGTSLSFHGPINRLLCPRALWIPSTEERRAERMCRSHDGQGYARRMRATWLQARQTLSNFLLGWEGEDTNPGIEPSSCTLQADSLPTELSGKNPRRGQGPAKKKRQYHLDMLPLFRTKRSEEGGKAM